MNGMVNIQIYLKNTIFTFRNLDYYGYYENFYDCNKARKRNMLTVGKLFPLKMSTFHMRPLFKKSRSKFGREADCLHNVPKYRVSNCYIPGGSNPSFVDFLDYLIDLILMIEYIGFLTQG